jgi:hypothetical protein
MSVASTLTEVKKVLFASKNVRAKIRLSLMERLKNIDALDVENGVIEDIEFLIARL